MCDASTCTVRPLPLPFLVLLSLVSVVPSAQHIDGHLHGRSSKQGDAEAHVASDGAVSMPPLRENQEHMAGISVTNRSLPHSNDRIARVDQHQKAPMVRSAKGKKPVSNGEVYISPDGEVSAPMQVTRGKQESQAPKMASLATLERYRLHTGKKPDEVDEWDSDLNPVVHCKWGKWSKWSVCSEECEGGDQQRKRIIVQRVKNGGGNCKGPHQQTQTCNEQDCPTTPRPETTTTAAAPSPSNSEGTSATKKQGSPAPAPALQQGDNKMLYIAVGAVVVAAVAGGVFVMQRSNKEPLPLYDEFGEIIYDANEPLDDVWDDDGEYDQYS